MRSILASTAACILTIVGAVAGSAIATDAQEARAAPATRFALCHAGGGVDCVVDGDTIRLAGVRIRISDIDAPETHPPRCALEADLGRRATERLQALLNAGAVTIAGRGRDRYGRTLAVLSRGGRSIGMTLVAEGLARPWDGRRRPWCDDQA